MSLSSAAAKLDKIEPLNSLLRLRYRRRFRTPRGAGCWSGVYQSFAAALQDAPPAAPVGYDHAGAATLYDDMVERVQPKDYPVLYWLRRCLRRGASLFDFGGSAGVSFYAYQRYVADVAPAPWIVCDTPSVVEVGRTRAAAVGADRLRFTSEFGDASGCDVLFTAGTLQYVEPSFHDMVSRLARKPAHIIVNMLPTVPDRTIITLQNIGVSFCPYRIIERSALATSLQSVGYALEDSWVNPESRTRIPYADGVPEITWIGQYFRLAA